MANNPRYWAQILILLLVLLALAAGLSLSVGAAGIRMADIPAILMQGPGSADYGILTGIRLPRMILGLAMGGALALAGTLLQGMFKNPLVEPYTLGISGGASLGICVNVLFKLHAHMGILAYPLTGFAGASLVIFLVYGLNRRSRHLRSNRMLLTGVMISYVASSLVMLFMALAETDDLQTIVLWIMGSLDEPDMDLIRLALGGSLAGLLLSYLFCRDLNALLLGEEEAASLGVNTGRTKKGVFFIASFLTGLSVSVAGVIMFVGLIVPHFMRMVTGPDHRILLVSSYLGGAVFLMVCDVVARTVIAPLELPVGVITGIIGGVVFIWAISRKKGGDMSPLLEVQNLSLAFGRRRVLEAVSFDLAPGEIVSIIGPNGAGKTSLVRAVAGQLSPAAGTIRLKGREIHSLDNGQLARQMAVVRQILEPLPMNVAAYVGLGRLPFFKPLQFFDTRKDRQLARQYMKMTGIGHLAESSMDRISGGERQLAALARALTQEPALLVLDEPTAHLDITHSAKILELISELRQSLNLTVLMVIHDLNLAAEYSDRLVLVNKERGTLHALGRPERVLTRENIRAVYHTRVEIARNPVSGNPCIFLARERHGRARTAR